MMLSLEHMVITAVSILIFSIVSFYWTFMSLTAYSREESSRSKTW